MCLFQEGLQGQFHEDTEEGDHLGLIVSKCSKVGAKMWFKWTKYSDQTNFELEVLYEWNQGHWNVFRVRCTWSKYVTGATFLRPKYRNSLVMKISCDLLGKHGWHSQVNLTYSYNRHLGIMIQISEWGWIRKKMVQHQVYISNFGVTYQGQKVVQMDSHFGVQWLIQYFWCHFRVQIQIFGSNMNLNPLIQSGPGGTKYIGNTCFLFLLKLRGISCLWHLACCSSV